MDTLAAANTVLWVGILRIVLLFVTSCARFRDEHSVKRPWVLGTDLIFPFAALFALGIDFMPTPIFMGDILDRFPANFWRNMPFDEHKANLILLWMGLAGDVGWFL